MAETTYVTDTDDPTTQTPPETTTTAAGTGTGPGPGPGTGGGDNETSTLRAAAAAANPGVDADPDAEANPSAEDTEAKPQIFQETTEESPMYKLRGINACPVKEEVVAPFWANNTRGEVLALLNLYPFEQYVHWERCTYENKQMFCRQGCRCEQQYRLHRLLAYDPNNDCRGIFSDWFKFPSCCVCRCYDLPSELRITSRSPRERKPKIPFPEWFRTN